MFLLILFPSKDKEGKAIADATKDGSFKIIVGSEEFKFRLSFGSVLPSEHDPMQKFEKFLDTQIVMDEMRTNRISQMFANPDKEETDCSPR
jgi:hypothetical protein